MLVFATAAASASAAACFIHIQAIARSEHDSIQAIECFQKTTHISMKAVVIVC
jgi:hypothetical protein